MKCAFVIPSWRPEDIFSSKTAGSQINYWQPLGTLYVAGVIREAGHAVRFLNGAFMSQTDIEQALQEFSPDVVGIYATAFGWPRAQSAAARFRKLLPAGVMLAGGPYPIAVQEKCLTDCPELDAVVTGEGEYTMLDLLNQMEHGKPWHTVLGLACRKNGQIRTNPPRPLITDLDALPFPARDLLGGIDDYVPPPATYKRRPVAVIITSRGCNRRCIYCFQIDRHRTQGIRYRSVDNVLEEIELCLAQGYREIKFIDDTLAADRERAMCLAREIQRRELDFTWFASACVHQVDRELLAAFKAAGCWAILFGAESGVQKDLNTIRKGITLEQTRKAVRAAKEVGLTVYTPFLFGIPGQTFADGLQSIDFAIELDPDFANFHALTPFPGTELHDNIEQYGTMSRDLGDYSYQGAAFTPYTMTREEISSLRQIAFRRFYGRPRYLLRRLLALRTRHDMKAALQGGKSLFWLLWQRNLFQRR